MRSADYYRGRADETRTIAIETANARARQTLFDIAKQYDELVVLAERTAHDVAFALYTKTKLGYLQ